MLFKSNCDVGHAWNCLPPRTSTIRNRQAPKRTQGQAHKYMGAGVFGSLGIPLKTRLHMRKRFPERFKSANRTRTTSIWPKIYYLTYSYITNVYTASRLNIYVGHIVFSLFSSLSSPSLFQYAPAQHDQTLGSI